MSFELEIDNETCNIGDVNLKIILGSSCDLGTSKMFPHFSFTMWLNFIIKKRTGEFSIRHKPRSDENEKLLSERCTYMNVCRDGGMVQPSRGVASGKNRVCTSFFFFRQWEVDV